MTARRRYARRPSHDEIKAWTPEARARYAQALVPGLRGQALEHWIETGEGFGEQLEQSRAGWNPAKTQVR